MKTAPGKIVITIVNYFNDDEVIAFIKNQLGNHIDNLLVCVVNNGSNRPIEFAQFCSGFKNVHLIEAGKNSGYFGAAAISLNYLCADLKMELPSLFILSNTDITIETPDFFNQLKSKYENSTAGMIGPRIVSTKHGHEQNPYYVNRITKSKLKRIVFLCSVYPFYVCYQKLSNFKAKVKGATKTEVHEINNVYAIHGSMLVFTKALLQKASTFFKDAPFLFGEEIYAAEVCRLHNLPVVFDSTLLVYHDEHATTGLFKSKKSLKYMQQSLSEILDKFFK